MHGTGIWRDDKIVTDSKLAQQAADESVVCHGNGMDARIKNKSFPGEILRIAADLEMFLAHSNAHPLFCEERAAGKAADAGADDYNVEII